MKVNDCFYICVTDETAKSKTVKKQRLESRDSAEVRRYMLRRREEQRRQERRDIEMKMNRDAKKQQRLNELIHRQHKIVAASVAVSREKNARLKVSLIFLFLIFLFSIPYSCCL